MLLRKGNLTNPALAKHMAQEGRQDLVDFKPHGYRDVIWCPIINEPVIMIYKGDRPHCSLCEMSAEADGGFAEPHPFIVSIIGPYQARP